MMKVIVTLCGVIGLTFSELKAEILALAGEGHGGSRIGCHCSRQGIQQDENIRVPRRAFSGRDSMELFNGSKVRLQQTVRILTAEVAEALLYGCVTWSRINKHIDALGQANVSLLLR